MASSAALEIHRLHQADKERLQQSKPTTYTIQVFNEFCHDPILTGSLLIERHSSTKPKVNRAFQHLLGLRIIREISSKQRNRKYAYHNYLQILVRDTNTKVG